MRRFMLPGLFAAIGAAVLALLVFGVAAQGVSTSIDASVARGDFPLAPDWHTALPKLGAPGSESLADFRGKVVVMNVFASWCQPCQAESALLEREQHALAGKNATILGVTYLDNTVDSEQFVREEHITYPVVRDVTGSFSRSWGIDGVPETFVINAEGRIVALRRYQLAGDWLSQTVSRVLAHRS